MHRPPGYRHVHGVLLLDKPLGLSSNQALQKARKLFRAKKAGHTGSLDPQASGLLPLCFGEATKISAYLLDADKHYQTTARLGTVTDSGDQSGEVTQTRPVPDFTRVEIEAVLKKFRGETQQIPPMYSALHHQGKRLYQLAREGKQVERKPRPVKISSLILLDQDQLNLTLDVHCSKGTYIRTLVEDIGEALGCGAHVTQLRRVSVAPFTKPEMYTLDELESMAVNDEASLLDCLTPMDEALKHWPKVVLEAEASRKIAHGQPVNISGADAERLVLYTNSDQFLGIGSIRSGKLIPKRLINQELIDFL